MNDSKESLGAAVAKIPSGCSILTVDCDGRRTGVLVSWIQQASFEPLRITVCVKHGRPVGALIDAEPRFLINVIGEDASSLFQHFGKGFSLEEDAFAGVEFEESPFGPMLAEGIAHLGCSAVQRIDAGDHDVYLAEVHSASAADASKPYVHLRKSGFSY